MRQLFTISVGCCVLLGIIAGCSRRSVPETKGGETQDPVAEAKEKDKSQSPPDKPNNGEPKKADDPEVVKPPKSDKRAGDVASGPDLRMPGHFEVKTITGEVKGDKVCFYCEFAKKQLPAGVVIFSRKADDNVAALLKALDGVKDRNPKLGTVLVGIDDVSEADLRQFQDAHKLKTPLTVSVEKRGVERHQINKEAAVTVVIYKLGGPIHRSFGFRSTKAAAAQAGDIAAAAEAALLKTQDQ